MALTLSSSMVPATTAAPYFFASAETCGLGAISRGFAFTPSPGTPGEGGGEGRRGLGARFSASQSSFKCSGIVPQHPPTTFTPNSLTYRITPLAKSLGFIGKQDFPSTITGNPALGSALTYR